MYQVSFASNAGSILGAGVSAPGFVEAVKLARQFVSRYPGVYWVRIAEARHSIATGRLEDFDSPRPARRAYQPPACTEGDFETVVIGHVCRTNPYA